MYKGARSDVQNSCIQGGERFNLSASRRYPMFGFSISWFTETRPSGGHRLGWRGVRISTRKGCWAILLCIYIYIYKRNPAECSSSEICSEECLVFWHLLVKKHSRGPKYQKEMMWQMNDTDVYWRLSVLQIFVPFPFQSFLNMLCVFVDALHHSPNCTKYFVRKNNLYQLTQTIDPFLRNLSCSFVGCGHTKLLDRNIPKLKALWLIIIITH